jgi:hypothetical protein
MHWAETSPGIKMNLEAVELGKLGLVVVGRYIQVLFGG